MGPPDVRRPPLDGGAAAGGADGRSDPRHDSRRYQKGKLTRASREEMFKAGLRHRLMAPGHSDQRRGPRGGSR